MRGAIASLLVLAPAKSKVFEKPAYLEGLRRAIEQELKMSLSQQNSQGQTVERLVELVSHSIETMGTFQRTAIKEASEIIFDDMLQNITRPTEIISDEGKLLHEQIQQVQRKMNLPVLQRSRNNM